MRILLLIATALSFSVIICAQETRLLLVKAGEIPTEVLPVETQYCFPVFTDGVVYLRDGSFSRQRLNYSILLNEMHFIGAKGDTLAIADPGTIKQIVVDTVSFYYDQTYLRKIPGFDSIKLAVNEFLFQSPYTTRGGYDMPTAASAITTYSSITANGSIARLQVKKDVVFSKGMNYFISDPYNHFSKADKKAFLSIFAKKRNELQDYLKDHHIDFSKRPDLERLLAYCISLK